MRGANRFIRAALFYGAALLISLVVRGALRRPTWLCLPNVRPPAPEAPRVAARSKARARMDCPRNARVNLKPMSAQVFRACKHLCANPYLEGNINIMHRSAIDGVRGVRAQGLGPC